MSTSAVTPLGLDLQPGVNTMMEPGILDRTVCIAIRMSGIGNRKKVSTSMIDVPLGQEKSSGASAPVMTPDGSTVDAEGDAQLAARIILGRDDEAGVWVGLDSATGVLSQGETEVEARVATVEAIKLHKRAEAGAPADPKAPAVDKTMLGVSKMLLDSPELRAVRKHDGKIRKYVYDKCLPYEIGIHLLPNELVVGVEEQLQAFAAERETLISKFLAAYPAQIEAAGKRLLVLFNQADYKGLTQVRDAFTFDWQYLSFGTPGKLKDISPALFAAEQEKAARKWKEASDTIEQVLRAQMKALVEKLQEKLAPSGDGKPKAFRKESIVNLREFIAEFDIRNVTSDTELKVLVERAKGILGNVDANDIRSNEKLRAELAESFTAITSELKDIVVEGNSRAIMFEDEDE